MKKNKRKFLGAAAIAVIAAIAAAGSAMAALASCEVSVDKDILNELNPPDHQLVLSYGDLTYAAESTLIFPTSYTNVGDGQVLTMQNKLGDSNLIISAISVDDAEHFTVADAVLPLTLAPLESQPLRLSFSSQTAGTFLTNLTIAYTAEGKNRTISVRIRATRSLDDVAQISLQDDSNQLIDNNNDPAYSFGFSPSAIVKTFTIRNTGDQTLTISSIISNNTADFSIVTNPATTVEVGGSTTFRVSRTVGNVAASASLTIISNAANIPIFTFNVASLDAESGVISVLGPDGTAVVRATGIFNDLGYSTAPTLSRTFTVRNTGGANLTINYIGSGSTDVTVAAAPTPGTVIAPSGETSFTLRINPVARSEAAINIISDAGNASTFTFNVCGGGSTLNLDADSSFVCNLSEEGYDFGYQNAAADRTITFTNAGNSTVVIDQAATTAPSGEFSIQGYGAATIAPDATGNVQVRFTPDADAWSESSLTLHDVYGRSWKLNLSGSGFPQPDDIEAPALWLRADRVRLADTTVVSGERVTSVMPDGSGRGIDAAATSDGNPKYIASGINGRPSLEFYTTIPGTTTYTNYTVRAEPSSGHIIDPATSDGTTIAIVFKTYATSGGNSNKYILQPWYTSSSTATFGQLYLEQSPTNYYRFRIYSQAYPNANASGYEVASVYPEDYWSGGRSVRNSSVYSIVEALDPSIARPNKNRFLWINGNAKALGDWPVVGQFRNLDTQTNFDTTPTPYHNNINYITYQPNNQTMHMLDVGRIYQISEVIVYPRPLTTDEVEDLNDYFAGKFNMGAEPL